MATKKRLDSLVQERFPNLSKTYIQSLIMQGKVLVDDRPITKAGTAVADDVHIRLKEQEKQYVSRAGNKLAGALDHFGIDVTGFVAMDAGLSTGGFTDCLLQRGAIRVYGVDVGTAQVHEKIRIDPRVVVMEQTNLRHLESLPELVDIVTLDLSFISILKVITVVDRLLKPGGILVTLVKPQFEAERHQIGKGGIVTDDTVHQEVIQKVIAGVVEQGFEYKGIIESPITGTDGNKEFLAYFVHQS